MSVHVSSRKPGEDTYEWKAFSYRRSYKPCNRRGDERYSVAEIAKDRLCCGVCRLTALFNRIKISSYRSKSLRTRSQVSIRLSHMELRLFQIYLSQRRFGSQRVLLYADPDSQITVTAARHNDDRTLGFS